MWNLEVLNQNFIGWLFWNFGQLSYSFASSLLYHIFMLAVNFLSCKGSLGSSNFFRIEACWRPAGFQLQSFDIHACSGKNEVVKQLWWLDYQLCFTLLCYYEFLLIFQEVWSKVCSLAIKVSSQLRCCLNMRVLVYSSLIIISYLHDLIISNSSRRIISFVMIHEFRLCNFSSTFQ